MEDWEARLTALERRLREWNVRYAAELAAVAKERGLRRLLRRPRPDELEAAALEAQRRAGEGPLAELEALADELCDRYEAALPQDRAKIRARVGAAESFFELFWSYVERGPDRVRGPNAEKAFRRALVALAIDDLRAEIEQVDAVLARLLVAAAAAGVDWKAHLADVAKLANPGMAGGGACLREHLARFGSTPYFRREVAERLRAAARA